MASSGRRPALLDARRAGWAQRAVVETAGWAHLPRQVSRRRPNLTDPSTLSSTTSRTSTSPPRSLT